MEIWRTINNWSNYEVSNLGRVRNKKTGRILRQYVNEFGYSIVDLHNYGKVKHYRVHRLVAQSFLPSRQNCNQVNHKDGNKANNNSSNLEWVTQSENVNHCYKNLRKKGCSPTPKQIICVENNNVYASISEAARCFNVSSRTLQRALDKENLSALGYHWRTA